jgi:cell division septum initiation protein DivIVA
MRGFGQPMHEIVHNVLVENQEQKKRIAKLEAQIKTLKEELDEVKKQDDT